MAEKSLDHTPAVFIMYLPPPIFISYMCPTIHIVGHNILVMSNKAVYWTWLTYNADDSVIATSLGKQ